MKTAFVTGAATGIGEGLVNKLLAEGWQVFAGIRQSAPESARWYGHPQVIPLSCDIASEEDRQQAAAVITEKTGGTLDLLVNNAGYPGSSGVIEAADMEDYRKTLEINFWGTMALTQILIPLLKASRGRIINVTSPSVYMTIPMGSSYPVSKMALKTLSFHLKMELEPFGVDVTTLEPGGVATPMTALDDQVADGQWQAIPEPLRQDYQRYFKDSASAIGSSFKLYSPDEFADAVYRKVIRARHWKPVYLIGPLGATALPWMHRLLPVATVQKVWRRMFRH